MVRIVVLAAVAAGVLVCGASAAGSSVVISFRTPSGNIGCGYASGLGGPPSLRCDIRSGLRPRPARPRGCVDLEWGDSFQMNRTGRAGVTCHGDTVIDPRARVLRYGSSWARDGFKCVSRTTGLRCRNRSGHGFFMSRARSVRF
ncbi:MAG: hypothetical protein M3R70_07925 [Actinomycetota bacterium]|nr:hypothetical protein [Actinomycetota bacterium]